VITRVAPGRVAGSLEAGDDVIEIQDLYKYYGERRAVGPLSATIDQGEIVGLLGLNGAGKTTTLRVLACDLLPTSGTVKVGGLDVVERPHDVRAKVGYLPDRPPLYEDMKVHEYLSYAARLRRVPSNDVQKRVSDVEELTELGAVRQQLIGTLSHGYRQRVGIAQAIVHRPELVVLDEPISGLDPVQIVEMRELVRNLRGEHTVVVSSHILTEISETCDRIFVIKDGEIRWAGKEQELSRELAQGQRVEITVRARDASGEEAEARARKALEALSSIQAIESLPASEPGEGVSTLLVSSSADVRDEVCRLLVGADLGILQVARTRELENLLIDLLGEPAEASQGKRRKKKRALEGTTEADAAEASGSEAS
jgi:ABC-2 type transport system ATP-binding protein